MRLQVNATLTKVSQTYKPFLESVGISEQIIEDVSHFIFTDDGIKVFFNTGEEEVIPLRSNNTQGGEDWRGVNIFITRKFLNVDMSK